MAGIPGTSSKIRIQQTLIGCAALICMGILGSLPFFFLLYGALGTAIFGFLLLGSLAALQYVVFFPIWRKLQAEDAGHKCRQQEDSRT